MKRNRLHILPAFWQLKEASARPSGLCSSVREGFVGGVVRVGFPGLAPVPDGRGQTRSPRRFSSPGAPGPIGTPSAGLSIFGLRPAEPDAVSPGLVILAGRASQDVAALQRGHGQAAEDLAGIAQDQFLVALLQTNPFAGQAAAGQDALIIPWDIASGGDFADDGPFRINHLRQGSGPRPDTGAQRDSGGRAPILGG